MEQDITIYLAKVAESLQTAESEFANGRYNSCANRCYYACFQAAIAALLSEGIRPRGQWSHEFVHGQFVGVFINQRHFYETQLRRGEHSVILTFPATAVDSAQTPERVCRYTWHIAALTCAGCLPHTTKHRSA